ncbi:hypothetical protein D9M69_704820 [compost metagenome]
MSTFERAHPVAELGHLARMQLHPLRQELELHGRRHLIEDLDSQAATEAVVQGQAHIAPATEGQVAQQLALQARRWQAAQPQGIEQAEQ